jgi:hypothetical protein
MGGINTSTSRIRPQADGIADDGGVLRRRSLGHPSTLYPPDGWYGAVIRIGTIVSPQWMRSTASARTTDGK